jgi:AcrR family transcriptional regulator
MGTRSAEDWVRAAFTVLARKGAEFVRVEPLAKQLRVTKGSFYWHFKDRAAFLRAVLEEWERVATSDVIDLVNARRGTARDRLTHLMLMTASHLKAARIEHAMRVWGATDRAAREALVRVDARREAYVRDLLLECGVREARSSRRSHGLYLMLLGEYTRVSHGAEPSPREVWEEQIDLATRG